MGVKQTFDIKICISIELFVQAQFTANWGLVDGGIRPICLNCLNCPYQPPGGREVWHVRTKSSDKIVAYNSFCVKIYFHLMLLTPSTFHTLAFADSHLTLKFFYYFLVLHRQLYR